MKEFIPLHMISIILTVCVGCQQQDTTETLQVFYKTYSDRKDFEAFMAYYDEDAVLEDMVNGDKIIGKKSLRQFFDWHNPEYKPLEDESVVVTSTVVEGNRAVATGFYGRFQWGSNQFGRMQFTTILTFNEAGKIIKHIDWINYPSSLVDYNNRKDSNKWLE